MNRNDKPLILIVDDNPQNIQVLGSILEKNGYETAVAMSGKQALIFLTEENPELILLDIMMPEMDGYEVCREIKKSKTTKYIPVIFLSAKMETEDLLTGFKAGAVDYVTKPFNPPELLARIKTHIELKRSREEIKTLRGFLPICANCKKIRDEKGRWHQVESYIRDHSEVEFSHAICPECAKKLYGEFQ